MGRHSQQTRRGLLRARDISPVVALLLVVAAAINVAQFRAIDESTVDSFDAVHHNPTADIMAISYPVCESCQQRYGLHLALWMIAPGSRVIVDANGPYARTRYDHEEFELRLFSVGRVSRVDWLPADAARELLARPDGDPAASFDPTPYIVASGEGGAYGRPWALALASGPPQGAVGSPDDFVSDSLAAGGDPDREATPREFVVLRWDIPRGSRHAFQDLVLETSLLPESIRQELEP